jgi:hypothetical protein
MAEETKKNPPNLFTDPNFRRLSDEGKRAAFDLLMHDQYDDRLPGLWFFAIYGDTEHVQQAERFVKLYEVATANTSIKPKIGDFLRELQETGWFELDEETSLVRVSFAPLYYPPKDKYAVWGWLHRWHRMPECEVKNKHLVTMRAACEYDPALVEMFDRWVVKMPPFAEE